MSASISNADTISLVGTCMNEVCVQRIERPKLEASKAEARLGFWGGSELKCFTSLLAFRMASPSSETRVCPVEVLAH